MGIYFDNAATSYPKPEVVYQAVSDFMRNVGTSAGHGAYQQALKADKIIYRTRQSLAKLFNVRDISWIVFTANVTESINFILAKGIDRICAYEMELTAYALENLKRLGGISIK
jgi:selenocysteine lyase/cysteine desulfurase